MPDPLPNTTYIQDSQQAAPSPQYYGGYTQQLSSPAPIGGAINQVSPVAAQGREAMIQPYQLQSPASNIFSSPGATYGQYYGSLQTPNLPSANMDQRMISMLGNQTIMPNIPEGGSSLGGGGMSGLMGLIGGAVPLVGGLGSLASWIGSHTGGGNNTNTPNTIPSGNPDPLFAPGSFNFEDETPITGLPPDWNGYFSPVDLDNLLGGGFGPADLDAILNNSASSGMPKPLYYVPNKAGDAGDGIYPAGSLTGLDPILNGNPGALTSVPGFSGSIALANATGGNAYATGGQGGSVTFNPNINVNQSVTQAAPRPTYNPLQGYVQYQQQPQQQQPSYQPSYDTGGPMPLSAVDAQWAEFYRQQALQDQAAGRFSQSLSNSALSGRLLNQSRQGPAGYGYDPNNMVMNPYLPANYSPTYIGVRPLEGGGGEEGGYSAEEYTPFVPGFDGGVNRTNSYNGSVNGEIIEYGRGYGPEAGLAANPGGQIARLYTPYAPSAPYTPYRFNDGSPVANDIFNFNPASVAPYNPADLDRILNAPSVYSGPFSGGGAYTFNAYDRTA